MSNEGWPTQPGAAPEKQDEIETVLVVDIDEEIDEQPKRRGRPPKAE